MTVFTSVKGSYGNELRPEALLDGRQRMLVGLKVQNLNSIVSLFKYSLINLRVRPLGSYAPLTTAGSSLYPVPRLALTTTRLGGVK